MPNLTVTIGNRILTQDEKEQLYNCISCRLGIIETGTLMMRSRDAINCGKQNQIKPLSTDQMKLVIMLEEIMYQLI